jgi:enamine deaminase RidA (YjgF/YER057c/UK114 family)
MSSSELLAGLGLRLPTLAMPVANYVPYKLVLDKLASGMLYVSGQIPFVDGQLYRTGKLGAEVSLEDGIECARLSTLNSLAWANEALAGDLSRVWEVVMVRCFVASTPDFYEQPKIANGASDLLVAVFGERGKHARAALGAPSLPMNAPVEIDIVMSIQ